MKKIVLFAICISLTFATMAQTPAAAPQLKGRFYFKTGENHFFGTLQGGPVAMDTFWFENIGNAPIQITFVSASAKHITTDWMRTATRPGQIGFVAFTMKTTERNGYFSETLYIESNAAGDPKYQLHIKGNIQGNNLKAVKKKKPVAKKPVAVKP